MTVESLIKSAIADEVNAKLNPKIVEEIVDKKIQRLTKKIVDELDIKSIVRKELKDFFNTYDGQKLIRSTIANSLRITLVTEKEK